MLNIQRLVRLLDRGFLRLTNPLRDRPIGYIEKTGTIEIVNGQLHLVGWEIHGLGRATGVDLTGPTLVIAGRDTGVILPKDLFRRSGALGNAEAQSRRERLTLTVETTAETQGT